MLSILTSTAKQNRLKTLPDIGFSAALADVTQIPAQEIKYYINKKIEPTIRGDCKTTQIDKWFT